jgi:hypothetical protein
MPPAFQYPKYNMSDGRFLWVLLAKELSNASVPTVQSWVLNFNESGATDILVSAKVYLSYEQEMTEIPTPIFEWSLNRSCMSLVLAHRVSQESRFLHLVLRGLTG